jgi:thioredoxin-related protein
MSGIDRRAFLLLAPAWGLGMAAAAAAAAIIPLAADLRADGRLSRARREPIVILFSLPGCPYCEIVRRSHLAPMLRDPQQGARVIIRQIDIDGDQAIVGFSGERVTPAQLATAHGVRAAPVVAFWDGDGKPIAESLSGMLLPDFYSAYLEAALDSARQRLASGV